MVFITAIILTDTIAPYAKSYLGYILIGTPYMASSFVLNNILRFQGSAFYAMLGIGTGGIINIVFGPHLYFWSQYGYQWGSASHYY